MKPMLAKITDNLSILSNEEYIFEPKLDGYRSICIKNSKINFYSRNNHNITADFKEFNFSKNILAKNCILDGEIVIYDKKGNPSFSLMQNRKINNLPAVYVVFDILSKDGKDLTSLPLLERKKILSRTIIENKNLQLIFYTSDGKKLYKEMLRRGGEGVIAKQKNSQYLSSRTSYWLKIKFQKTLDCIIIGITKKKREISSLALGLIENNKLIFIGKVGTGFNERNIKEISSKIKILNSEKINGITAVKPNLVCEVKYFELTNEKKLRGAVFLRLREDKFPKECTLDQISGAKK